MNIVHPVPDIVSEQTEVSDLRNIFRWNGDVFLFDDFVFEVLYFGFSHLTSLWGHRTLITEIDRRTGTRVENPKSKKQILYCHSLG